MLIGNAVARGVFAFDYHPEAEEERSAFVRDRRAVALEAARRQTASIERRPRDFVVYVAVNTRNGKCYVGATGDFRRRVREHRAAAERGSYPLNRAMRKYGANVFVFVPLEEFSDEKAMNERERETIARLQTQDKAIGYNVADGGDGIGSKGAKEVHRRPEFRAKFLAGSAARGIKAAATTKQRAAAGYYDRIPRHDEVMQLQMF